MIHTVAPAKINWTLEVLGKRDGGYHEVRTVLQTIELHDELSFEAAAEFDYQVRGQYQPDEHDLVLRAASLLAVEHGVEHAGRLGLEGRVVLVDGVMRAYTFGYPRTASVWCVLFEVSDRTITGLAQWTFREFCREAAMHGYVSLNTMDASGLPELARSKEAYCPIRRIPSFIASR